MLDKELAELYGVSTKRLKQQVRRNLKRFPLDFAFELTWEEAEKVASRLQNATLNKGQNIKYLPLFNAIKELLADKEEAAKKKGPLGFIPPKLSESINKSKRK